jgi:hypothetical protein
MSEPLYALTLWQPHATLMAIEAKIIETRHWPAPRWLIGQPLAIHAAKTPPPGFRDTCRRPEILAALKGAGYLTPQELPLGEVLCVVRVLGCAYTETLANGLRADELAFGNYTPGRWGWVTELLHRFEPGIPARGAQSLWRWTPPADLVERLGL